MEEQMNPMQENRSLAERVLGTSLPALLEKRQRKDPRSFAEGEILKDEVMFPKVQSASKAHRRELMAIQAEMLERKVAERWPAWRIDPSVTNLFRQNGIMLDQKVARIIDPTMREAALKALRETTTPADIATVACQLIAIVTRAMANNPVLGLVGSFNLTQVSGQIAYLDVLRAASCGSYTANSRVDLQDLHGHDPEDQRSHPARDCDGDGQGARCRHLLAGAARRTEPVGHQSRRVHESADHDPAHSRVGAQRRRRRAHHGRQHRHVVFDGAWPVLRTQFE